MKKKIFDQLVKEKIIDATPGSMRDWMESLDVTQRIKPEEVDVETAKVLRLEDEVKKYKEGLADLSVLYSDVLKKLEQTTIEKQAAYRDIVRLKEDVDEKSDEIEYMDKLISKLNSKPVKVTEVNSHKEEKKYTKITTESLANDIIAKRGQLCYYSVDGWIHELTKEMLIDIIDQVIGKSKEPLLLVSETIPF